MVTFLKGIVKKHDHQLDQSEYDSLISGKLGFHMA